MARVFLSYATSDRPLADAIAESLLTLGHDVVYSDAATPPGENWRNVLSRSLRSADAVLLLITKTSAESPALQIEASSALAYANERGTPIVVPIVLDNVIPPASLQHILYIRGERDDIPTIVSSVNGALIAHLARRLAADEKKKEARAIIESSAGTYIKDSLKLLTDRENSLRRVAVIWYGLGYLALLAGVGAAVGRALRFNSASATWEGLAYFAVLGVAVVAMLIALARYAFSLGRSFMVESLRNSDRRHAISLGEFYIQAFPDRLDWDVLKDIFQQWNIDKGSAFLAQDGKDFDPELFAKVTELARLLVDRERPR